MWAAPPLTRHDSISWRAVIPAIAAVTVSILPGFLTAGLAVQVSADIGLTLAGLGAVIAVFFAASAAASSVMGSLVQRAGWAAGVRLSSILAAVTLGGIGFWATTPLILGAWFVLGGLGAGLSQPAANLTVARCVPSQRHGLLFGVKHASVPVATLLAGVSVPAIALTVGWEWAYWGGAILALLVAVVVPYKPADHETGAGSPDPPRGTGRPTTPLPLLIALSIAAILGIGGIDALASFFVTYAVDIGIGEGAAGLLLAAGSAAGIVTRLVAGWLIDRTQRADLTAIATMLAIGALGIAAIATGGEVGLLLGGLVGFAAGWGWSGLFTFAVVKDNPEAEASATGITMTGVWIGAAVGPLLFGVVADSFSFAVAWWGTAASLIGAAAIVLYVRRKR
jgi:MFS family permease